MHVINIPEWDGQARTILQVFRLRKGTRLAECTVVTHPIGAELRVTVDGQVLRSQAGRTGMAPLLELGLQWKEAFEEKWWSE